MNERARWTMKISRWTNIDIDNIICLVIGADAATAAVAAAVYPSFDARAGWRDTVHIIAHSTLHITRCLSTVCTDEFNSFADGKKCLLVKFNYEFTAKLMLQLMSSARHLFTPSQSRACSSIWRWWRCMLSGRVLHENEFFFFLPFGWKKVKLLDWRHTTFRKINFSRQNGAGEEKTEKITEANFFSFHRTVTISFGGAVYTCRRGTFYIWM